MYEYCNICHDRYYGLAMDCRCTNYGVINEVPPYEEEGDEDD